MDITSQITVPLRPELYQSVSESGLFKPGSTLVLKVLELQGDRALIDFGKFRARADIRVPVSLGDELLVRVQESGQQLKLNLINADQSKILSNEALPRHPAADLNYNQIQSDLRQILNPFLESQVAKTIPKNILHIFRGISAHLEPFDLTKIVAEIMPRLKSYVDNSGLFFEKTLENAILNLKDGPDPASPKQVANHPDILTIINRDLKANLMAMKHIAGDEETLKNAFDTRTLAALRRTVDLLLTDITSQQGRAVTQHDTSEPFQVVTYALPLTEDKNSAKLKVYYQKKQRDGSKNGFQISLLLSMDRLGDIRTDFHLLGKDLKITFFVKDSTVKSRLQENFQELPDLLNPLFNQVLLQVVVSEKKINDFSQEDIEITSDRRVDLRV